MSFSQRVSVFLYGIDDGLNCNASKFADDKKNACKGIMYSMSQNLVFGSGFFTLIFSSQGNEGACMHGWRTMLSEIYDFCFLKAIE